MQPPLRGYPAGPVIEEQGERICGLCIAGEEVVSLHVSYASYAGCKRDTFRMVGTWEPFGNPALGASLRWPYDKAFTRCADIRSFRTSFERAIRSRPDLALTLSNLLDAELSFREERMLCLLSRRVLRGKHRCGTQGSRTVADPATLGGDDRRAARNHGARLTETVRASKPGDGGWIHHEAGLATLGLGWKRRLECRALGERLSHQKLGQRKLCAVLP